MTKYKLMKLLEVNDWGIFRSEYPSPIFHYVKEGKHILFSDIWFYYTVESADEVNLIDFKCRLSRVYMGLCNELIYQNKYCHMKVDL
jgi:hypothetical protein